MNSHRCGTCSALLATGLILGAMAPALAAPVLRVASVQMRSTRDWKKNLKRIGHELQACAERGARVAVFPECAVSGYFEDAATRLSAADLQEAEDAIAGSCERYKIYAIVGMPWREGRNLYDSAIVLGPDGTVIERYHKLQLAEAWPAPGDHLSVFPVDGHLCSIIICHDERYPELVRLPVLAGAQVVFYLSHESGLRQERKINPYRAQIQARAVENTVFVVQANAPANDDLSGSHGQSRIISPDGNIVKEASIFNEEILVGPIDLAKASRSNAINSLQRGPLRDWWEEGVRQVRRIP